MIVAGLGPRRKRGPFSLLKRTAAEADRYPFFDTYFFFAMDAAIGVSGRIVGELSVL